MYAAAPGTLYWRELNGALDAGMTVGDIYRALANSASFQDQGAAFSRHASNSQFTNAFLDRLLGTEVTAQARDVAFSFVFDRLQAGTTRADVMKIALDALDAVSTSDVHFGAAARRLDNRIDAARDYTETLNASSADIAVLQSAIASVTSDPATRDAAIDRLREQPTVPSTPGADTGPESHDEPAPDSPPSGAPPSGADPPPPADEPEGDSSSSGGDTLEIGGGQGTYVMSQLPGVKHVTLTHIRPQGDISIVDAPAGTTLELTGSILTFATKLKIALADATGNTDVLRVDLNGLDGRKDGFVGMGVSGNLTMPGIEILDITSNILEPEAPGYLYANTLNPLDGDQLRTIIIDGNSKLLLSFSATTTGVTKIDASQASQDVLLLNNPAAQSMTFLGGGGMDRYYATSHGDVIDGGANGDAIDLSAESGVDRLIYNAGDSLLHNGMFARHDTVRQFRGAKDASGDASAADLIDLSSFGFTGAERSALVDKGVLKDAVVSGSTLLQPKWFVSHGEAHAVAIGMSPWLASQYPWNPVHTCVFVDTNSSGDFETSSDLFIVLSGVGNVTSDNFVF
jgi:hypothetical protein